MCGYKYVYACGHSIFAIEDVDRGICTYFISEKICYPKIKASCGSYDCNETEKMEHGNLLQKGRKAKEITKTTKTIKPTKPTKETKVANDKASK